MRKLVAVLLGALLVSSAAACGSSDSATDKNGLATVKVSLLPIIDVTPLYLGKDKGIFKKHGIDLQMSVVQTGAASTAAVLSNEAQIGFAAPVPEIQAQAKKLPLVVVAGGISQSDALSQAVVVPKGSSIKSITDLAGKTVAVNALQAVNDLVLRAALQKAGGDPDSIKFIALPYPDMKAALESKRIDAAFMIEPFLSAATGSGDPVVVRNPQLDVVSDGTALSTYFASKQYIAEHKDTLDNFLAALEEADAYAQQHPDEVRSTIPTFTQIPAEVAKKMAIGDFVPEVHVKTFEVLGNYMKQYGWIDDEPDLSTLIRQ